MLGVVGEDSSLDNDSLNGSIEQINTVQEIATFLFKSSLVVVIVVSLAIISTATVRYSRNGEFYWKKDIPESDDNSPPQ